RNFPDPKSTFHPRRRSKARRATSPPEVDVIVKEDVASAAQLFARLFKKNWELRANRRFFRERGTHGAPEAPIRRVRSAHRPPPAPPRRPATNASPETLRLLLVRSLLKIHYVIKSIGPVSGTTLVTPSCHHMAECAVINRNVYNLQGS